MTRRRRNTGIQPRSTDHATLDPQHRYRASTVSQAPAMAAYDHAPRYSTHLQSGFASSNTSQPMDPSTTETLDPTDTASSRGDSCPDPLPEADDPRWEYDPSPATSLIKPSIQLVPCSTAISAATSARKSEARADLSVSELEEAYPFGLRSQILYRGKPGRWLLECGLIPKTDYDGNPYDPSDTLVEMQELWFRRRLKKGDRRP